MISKTPELIISPEEKISVVWAFLKALPGGPDLHYYTHEFGTEDWFRASSPGGMASWVTDMPGDLYLIEGSKAFFVVNGIHYIAVFSGHDLYDVHLALLKGRFQCQLIQSSV